ncbi:MAG TPA: hypothetical protein VHX14_18850, partial [Thermoanaerobaculia bacterium]|nr:hypothetical protein [Thermoanaerobaculia bacterium]
YYFTNQIITIRDREDFAKQLSTRTFSPLVAFIPRPSFVPAAGIVSHVVETANTATLDAECSGQCFLVMSVTPHKYWTIRVDGSRVPAITTNIGYQGIILTPGRHHVVMEYRNELVRVGMLISLITGAFLTGILIVYRKPGDGASALPAYEERIHVVADAAGTHVEPAAVETTEADGSPDSDGQVG